MGTIYDNYGSIVGYVHSTWNGVCVFKGRGNDNHDGAIVARIQGNKIYSGGKDCHCGYDNLVGYVETGWIYNRSRSIIGRYSGDRVYVSWNLNAVEKIETAHSNEIGRYEGDSEECALAAIVLLNIINDETPNSVEKVGSSSRLGGGGEIDPCAFGIGCAVFILVVEMLCVWFTKAFSDDRGLSLVWILGIPVGLIGLSAPFITIIVLIIDIHELISNKALFSKKGMLGVLLLIIVFIVTKHYFTTIFM